jgi:hypothetical protein
MKLGDLVWLVVSRLGLILLPDLTKVVNLGLTEELFIGYETLIRLRSSLVQQGI